MNISVIMATYNGSCYIREQLVSILQQTILPTEIIVIDDCSDDNTLEIVNEIASEYSGINWKISSNAENVGWKENFFQLIKMASGDLIFYCDQDDIWDLKRIEYSTGIFEKNSKVFCLSCDYEPINEYGDLLVEKSYNGKLKKISYGDKAAHSALGCLLVFNKKVRSVLLESIEKKYFSILPVDLAIARTACILDGFYNINLPFVKHRFHRFNVSNSINVADNVEGSNSLENKVTYIYYDFKIMDIFSCKYEFNNDSYEYKMLINARANFFRTRNLLWIIKAFRYTSFDYRLALVLGDLAYFFGINKFAGKVYCKLDKLSAYFS